MKLKRIPSEKLMTRKRRSDWLAAAEQPLTEALPAAGGFSYPPLLKGRWHYPIVRITCANVSLQAAVEGGYGGVFGSVGTDQTCHLIEISASIPTLGNDGTADVIFGRRIIGALKTSDNSGSLSYAVAKATLKLEENTLAVETTGLADKAAETIRKMAGQSLTAESAKSFGEGIGACIKWIVDNAKLATTAARPAPLFQSTAPYDETKSVCFALGRIAEGDSLEAAIDELGGYHIRANTRETYAQIETAVVAAVYHRFRVMGDPTDAQRNQAKALLGGTGQPPTSNSAKKPFYRAVLPYVRNDGAIASLAHLATAVRIKAQPWPALPADLTPPKVQIGNEDLSFHTALDLGLGILGDIHLSKDLRFCGFRSWSTYRRSGASDTLILDEFYGAGIRASIRYSGAEIKGGATQLAAKVTLDRTAASFSIDIIGIDVDELPSIGAFASGAATVFDSQTLSLIGGIWSEVNSVITAHDDDDPAVPTAKKEAWKPCLTGVNLNLGANELQAIAGSCGPVPFALARIASGDSQDRALQAAPNADYRAAVDTMYAGASQPSSDARKRAKLLLNIGR